MIIENTEIILHESVAPDTWLMGLRSPQLARSARPGQFIMVRIGSGISPFLRRPFSVCAVHSDKAYILYRIVGEGTRIMAEESRVGGRISVFGPLGRGFSLPEKGKKILLVGGGIGIAPLISLAQVWNAHDLRFLAGFRSRMEIIRTEAIEDFSVPFVLATDDGSAGYAGPVTELLERELKNSIPGNSPLFVFSCGPRPMLRKVAQLSRLYPVSCQLSLESSMACGVGACQGCAVQGSPDQGKAYYHVCKDGPVFQAEAIEWS